MMHMREYICNFAQKLTAVLFVLALVLSYPFGNLALNCK